MRNPSPTFLEEHADTLAFVGIAGAVFMLLQAVYFLWLVDSRLFSEYLFFLADMAAVILRTGGEDVFAHGTILKTTGDEEFIRVTEGCDAIRIFSVLVAVIAAYDASVRSKVIGALLGVSLLFAANLLRIAMLLWLEMNLEQYFDLFHHTLLPGALWVLTMIYFAAWIIFGARPLSSAPAE